MWFRIANLRRIQERVSTKDGDWVDASSNAVRQGDVRVRISSVKVDFVSGTDFRDFKSKEQHLLVHMKVENLSDNRKVDFTGWQAVEYFDEGNAPQLRDNFNNKYKRITFGFATNIDGQILSASIYPEKSITDLLIFEVPVDGAEYLRLELPAKNFGGTGKLRLQIPKSMIQRAKSAD